MPEIDAPQPERHRPKRRFQFGLWTWFMLAFLVSVSLAPISGMLDDGSTGLSPPKHVLVVLLLVTPLAVVVLLSVLLPVIRGRKDRGGKDDH